MPRRLATVFIVAALLLLGPSRALSQTTQPAAPSQPSQRSEAGAVAAPTTRPVNPSAEDMLRQMLQPQAEAAQPLRPTEPLPREEQPAPSPVLQPTPDVTATGAAGAAGPLLREGTFLLDRVGRLTRRPEGFWFEFTLESDGRSLADPPMLLLPNQRLMQLEDRIRTSYGDPRVRVSGEVTVYRGRNYLLLQRWSVVPDAVQPLR